MQVSRLMDNNVKILTQADVEECLYDAL